MRLVSTTATFEVRLGPFAGEDVFSLADELMAALDAHADAVGPMVVADAARSELIVSFELAASGEPTTDVPRAMEILAEASIRHGGPLSARSMAGSVERLEMAFAKAS